MAKAAAIYLTELDLTRLENAANRAGSNSPRGWRSTRTADHSKRVCPMDFCRNRRS